MASKLHAFSGRYIGKKRLEEINPPKPVSLDRNFKTKRHPQAPGRTRNILTILKVIRLRNIISLTNGYDRKVERFKGSMPKASSKPSKPIRPSRNSTAQPIKS